MSLRNVVIASAARTPIGAFQGALSAVAAPRLGAHAIEAAVQRAGIEPRSVGEVIMGCVLMAGTGQAPARQAAIYAGLGHDVTCTTIHKVCGSGLKAVMLAADAIRLGHVDIAVAGGMENMSQTPYALQRARTGYRLGHGEITDLMIKDGLWDPYNDFHMGSAAELCAREHDIDRERQDAFATESYRRANHAIAEGLFADEIAPVSVPQRKGDPIVVDADEEPGRGKPERFGKLRPAFQKDGTITAANASSLNDGAAALVLMSEQMADDLAIEPLATFVAHASHAQAPEWFTTAPAKSIHKLLLGQGLQVSDVDLLEINEAFSVVSLVTQDELDLDPERVNVHGGAVALGHPIGASGARILVTLLHARTRRDAGRGVASLCIGGGESVAALVERS